MKEIFLKHKKLFALLAAMYLPISGGVDFVFIDYISDYIDSVNLVFLRLLIISVIFLAVHFIKEGRPQIEGRDIPKFLATGAFGTGLYYILESIGIAMTSASLSSLIMASVPAFGLIGDRIAFGNRITRGKLIGVAASIAGVLIIILSTGGSQIKGSLLGIGILILAAVSWTVYIVLAKPLHEKYSMLTITTGIFVGGTIVDIPIFLLYHPERVLSLAPVHWGLIAFFSVICVAAAQLLYLYGVKELSVTTSSIVMNLLPFTAILVSWIVFGEMLTGIQLVGGIIIIGAVTLASVDTGPLETEKP